MENFNGYYDRSAAFADTQSMLDSDIYDYDSDGYAELVSENDIYSEQLKAMLPQKRYAHPLLVLALMLICFPVGLFVMLCFTKWGAFPKAFVTLFVLAVAVAVYEILVAKQVLLLPSLMELIGQIFTA